MASGFRMISFPLQNTVIHSMLQVELAREAVGRKVNSIASCID